MTHAGVLRGSPQHLVGCSERVAAHSERSHVTQSTEHRRIRRAQLAQPSGLRDYYRIKINTGKSPSRVNGRHWRCHYSALTRIDRDEDDLASLVECGNE